MGLEDPKPLGNSMTPILVVIEILLHMSRFLWLSTLVKSCCIRYYAIMKESKWVHPKNNTQGKSGQNWWAFLGHVCSPQFWGGHTAWVKLKMRSDFKQMIPFLLSNNHGSEPGAPGWLLAQQQKLFFCHRASIRKQCRKTHSTVVHRCYQLCHIVAVTQHVAQATKASMTPGNEWTILSENGNLSPKVQLDDMMFNHPKT